MNVCLRFDNDRGLGWEISRERAAEILLQTDKAGLMYAAHYTGDAGDDATAGAICSCCTDCCYPHLATERLGTGDVWRLRHYVAAIDTDLCTSCGRCSRRCRFEAITSSHGRPDFDAPLGRGYGLCATGCSADAIEMRPLA